MQKRADLCAICVSMRRSAAKFSERSLRIPCNMDAKFLIVLLIAINCYSSCGAALRRTPKVYNALITTDENLTSSRAFPVIQPTIHETGVAHYPFGPYNPYGYGPYSAQPLVRFGQPIAPGFAPREPLPYPLPHNPFLPQHLPRPYSQGFPGYPGPNPPTAPPAPEPPMPEPQQPEPPQEQPPPPPPAEQPSPAEQQQPVKPPNAVPPPQGPNYMPIDENRPQLMPNEKLPLPLNEYGLPPALIPLPQYGPFNRQRRPVHLPPYGYNQYPLIYDPITGYREQYLPPYEYYPNPQTFAVGPPKNQPPPPQPPQPIQPAPTPAPLTTTSADQPATDEDYITEDDNESTLPQEPTEPSFESIKNGSKSKDSAIPDVPPPPIPSGAKSKQS